MEKTVQIERSVNRGFTLIELLIVSAVILILIAISTPLFRKSVIDLELRDTVSSLIKFVNYAHQRAVIEGVVYKMEFDSVSGTYRLFKATGVSPDYGFTVPADRFGKVFYIPRDIRIDSELREVFFYPDGHSDAWGLRLINKNNKVSVISSNGILGRIDVETKRG